MSKRKAEELSNYGARANIIAANPTAVVYNDPNPNPAQRARIDPTVNILPPAPTTTAQPRMGENADERIIPDITYQPALRPDIDKPGYVGPIRALALPGGLGNIPAGQVATARYSQGIPAGQYPIGRARRRKRFSGFSRRSFKFLRWLYHNRKKKRFTQAQAANAQNRRAVFFRAWQIARGQNRKYLTGADVKVAQGTVAGLPTGKSFF